MSNEEAIELLESYGLPFFQANLFTYMTIHGSSTVSTLAKGLRTNRMKVYRNLVSLQNKGLVAVILGRPMKYSPLPLNEALKTLMDLTRKKISEMEANQKKVLQIFSQISTSQQGIVESKFRFIYGRKNVYNLLIRMLTSARHEILILTTPSDILRLMYFGLEETLKNFSPSTNVRILTSISQEFPNSFKDLSNLASLRCTEFSEKTRIVIVDGQEALTSTSLDDSMDMDSEKDNGFWTDSP
ncbi:hypothetical protein KEJ18_04980 [Candidatus Bathyarchaeota archaeon]|nr:hypothetical protein [Candidatus Bathyarchaeota archaeon]